MRHHLSKSALNRVINQKRIVATTLSLMLVGAFLFWISSAPVYSSAPEPNAASQKGWSLAEKSPFILDASAKRSFSRAFRGNAGKVERKLHHRAMSPFMPLAPLVTATKTDALFIDTNNDNIANPGETIKYTVVITNSGSTDATGVLFNDLPDANTMLVPGSVTTTPVAIDDSYSANGNVRISIAAPGVLGNDSDADGNTFTASAGATSTNGGNVVMNADGSFTYNPAPGFEGTDTFNYTVTDSQGNTDGGTVTISVSGMIWFVDSSAASGGDGRLTSPFNCLVGAGCFDPVAADGPGDNIFLYSGNYTGGLTLLANQKLIGQGAGNTLALIAGITVAPDGDMLPATGGANPVITTAGGINGINLGSGNLLRGFTVGDTGGSDINGSGFGTLTVREVIVNGLGRALNLSSGVLDTDFGSIESIDSTVTGMTLSSVTGTFFSGSANIQNPAGIGISISSVGASSTVTFQNTTTVNASSGSGVTLTNNTGTVTFGDLDVAPDNNQRALTISNSVAVASPGKITITSGAFTTTNTLGTGQGSISIVGATAALRTPIDITLDSVTAINTISATGNVINLNNTTDDGFKIIGSGTTAGSGGTIQLAQQGAVFLNADNITLKNMNFVNANTLDGGLTCTSTTVTGCRGVINLNTVVNASMDNVSINRTVATAGTEYGVFGRAVSNLTIANSTFENQGDQNTEGVMRFSNLTGTSAFTNSTFRFASNKVVDVVNDSGTLDLNVTGTTISDTQTAVNGADGISVRGSLTANITFDVVNSTFLRLKTVGVAVFATGTSTVNANVTGSSFDPVAPGVGRGVDFASQNSGSLNFNVNNNPKIYSNGGTAVNIIALDTSNSQGRINNNTDIQAGTGAGSGIAVQNNQNANLTVEIDGNTISNVAVDRGIQAFSRLKTVAGAGRLDATITDNNITVGAGSVSDIEVQSGQVGSGDLNELCANVRTNTASGATGAAFREITGSPGSTVYLQGFVVNATQTWNGNLNTPLNSVFESNAGTLAGGTCNVPTNPSAFNYSNKSDSNLALNKSNGEAPVWARGISARVTACLDESAVKYAAPIQQLTASDKAATHGHAKSGRAIRGSKSRQAAAMHHAPRSISVAPSMAGPVSLNIGTIPAGESVTITFQVTINSPLVPPNTTQVANQGTVTGTNFGPVLTDDPDTGAANDPTVTPVVNPNNPPDAVDDTATVAEDSGANTINVLANDTTAPDSGETLTITAVTQGANGAVAITGGGTSVSYTPNPDFFGSDSFTYTVDDGNGGTDTATVNVTVTEVNDAPTAVNDTIANIAEDSGPYTIPFATLTGNDSKGPANESGQTLTIINVGNAVGGTVMISGTDVVFTPAANYNGPASFDYTVQDNGTTNGAADPKTDLGSVSFNINAVNDNPDAVDDAATVAEDSGANTINVLTNDSFAPDTGETLTITAVTQGTNGSVAITGSGTTVDYTPNPNFAGTDTFTYTISDGNGGTDTATVTVTVTNVNDNPTANDDSATVAEDSSNNAIDVLANDTAAPDTGETLTVTGASDPTNGTTTFTATGVSYTPDPNFFGTDTFTYTISDGNGGTDTATVTVTVTNVNDDPTAVDDAATVAEDSGATMINVLTNDSFAPDAGETLTVIAVSDPANGSATFTASNVSYTPDLNFFGTDTFTYTISDGNGGTDTATVTVTVTPVNDAPVANAGPDQTANCTGVVMLDGTGTTDVDNPNSTLTFVWKEGATIIATGETATVVLPVGTHTITLTVTDPGGLSSTDTVIITVVDNTGPTITLTNANITLWPPNHQYHTIQLSQLVASASDSCDPTVDINDVVVTSVSSDEAQNGNGDGNTMNDIIINPDCKSVQVRAERSVSGNGRVYTVTFQVADSSGNVTTATAKVSVPKNQNTTAVDDGPAAGYTVTSTCAVP